MRCDKMTSSCTSAASHTKACGSMLLRIRWDNCPRCARWDWNSWSYERNWLMFGPSNSLWSFVLISSKKMSSLVFFFAINRHWMSRSYKKKFIQINQFTHPLCLPATEIYLCFISALWPNSDYALKFANNNIITVAAARRRSGERCLRTLPANNVIESVFFTSSTLNQHVF